MEKVSLPSMQPTPDAPVVTNIQWSLALEAVAECAMNAAESDSGGIVPRAKNESEGDDDA